MKSEKFISQTECPQCSLMMELQTFLTICVIKKKLTLHDIGNLSDILIIYTEKANI